ncbi:nucleotidyltransferase family protein [Anaerobacillus sp. CMMVII]|uniref:nucleotidyltransferase domain-containing protein n=1 Tax=Anaerobacillus sp. CMMVII TaxID=2755588 RepID=UPI0021B84AE7|nr:nucleotidyltransferase family protein [Anaerobacillus sp. CMMVII]MCT8138139.1 nucleotidyltransferase family protein [Anaerobacillus sp. CMMVII]
MVDNFSINTTTVTKELSLILALLKNEEVREEAFESINWDLLIELAYHHRLYPILYSKLKKVNNSIIPEHVIQTLSNHYKRNTFQMLHLCGEMETVSELFLKQDIRLLFLKGPVLAHYLYGDLSLRTSCDLDFLIPIDKLGQAEALLIELGYVKDDYIKTVLNDWRWRHHHVTYYHPQKGIKLEIHWRLHPGPGKEQTFDELWKHKNTSSLTTKPVFYLGKEDLFLFLITHGARHGWSRLRWLQDIHQLLQKDLNNRRLTQLLTKYHYQQVAGKAIILAAHLFNTNLTREMKQLINGERPKKLAQDTMFYLQKMVNLHTDPVPEEVSRYHKRYLFSLMSFQQKVLFILSFLYPYPEDAETLPLPKKLHFLYFPLRPFLWVWRKTRKHALS